ncbi:MAG: hypothetical protein K2X93_05510 [Candidatus Obscuribacterales bacterium]|nr:hypothetical protein [Candidatus Obscuribacterales bacterium]
MSRTGSSLVAISLSVMLLGASITMPAVAADDPQLNFKIYNPESSSSKEPADEAPGASESEAAPSTTSSGGNFSVPLTPSLQSETPQLDDTKPVEKAPANASDESADAGATTGGAASDEAGKPSTKVLKGYVKVVPTGTKIPIVMDTAVDSDTSQEGDEFSARTSEDLSIDGSTVVPAGSIIKGRIAQLNSPRALNRSGSVGLKFDTITTPDQRQIPIVANLVARGGVVHARRGLKDVAFDTGAVTLPMLAGVGIGFLAGNSGTNSNGVNNNDSNNKIGRGGGALIGAGVGIAVGVAILLSKKGKKVEVKPGDELKIELAEDLRMPELNM